MNRLKECMKNININAADLSKRSGVKEASISQYVNNRCYPSMNSAKKLASVLHCDPLYLMGFDVDSNQVISNQINSSHDPEELRLIRIYRSLNKKQKLMLIDQIKFIKKYGKES